MAYFRKLFFKKVTGIRDTYILQEGDIALDEDDYKLYRGDGVTPGGIVIDTAGLGGGGGISLTDLSVTQNAASGSGTLSYNNSTGVFSYTPPTAAGLGLTETNDLTASVTWADVPDANITQTSVTQHQSALTITESQISDLGTYLTDIVDDTTPQLGGGLDLNSNDITGTGNISITGNITSTSTVDADTVTTDGISITDNNINATRTNDDLILSPSGTGSIVLNGDVTFSGNVAGVLTDIADDTNPQLGGSLDLNTNDITGTGNISITGNITSTGVVDADTVTTDGMSIFDNNITTTRSNDDLVLGTSGTGNVVLGNFVFDIDQTVGAGQDNYVLTYDHSSGLISLEASAGGGISLTDLSVTTASAGSAALTYNNLTGEFTYTPPDLSSYAVSGGALTATSVEPELVTADSTDGTDFTMTGGDASGLNSFGGDAIITGGDGALTDGNVLIGTTQTNAITIGAVGVTTAIGGNTTVAGTATFSGNAIFNTGVEEAFDTLTNATGTVTHNCDNGHIFYHTSPSANFTANFTNLGLTAEYATNLMVIINQGATARIVSAVQIGGAVQTINWQGGTTPTGTNNGIDAFSFTILRDGVSYVVLGQMVDFT